MKTFPPFRLWSAAATLVAAAVLGTGSLQAAGHPRPAPDKLQPTLDPTLPPYRPSGPYTGTLNGNSSETIPDLLKLWIDRFHNVQPGVTITFKPSGGEPAAEGLVNHTAQFGVITREISPDGAKHFIAANGYPPLAVPVCGGSYRINSYSAAMTFIVNKDNPLDKITFAQLDAIYSSTRKRGYPKPIRTWGDLGLTGEWANKRIHPWSLKPWDGFEEFIRLTVLDGGTFRDGIRHTLDTTSPLPNLVHADPCAISILPISRLNEEPGIKPLAIAVDSSGPYHQGTAEEVFGWTWPLGRLLYIYVDRKPGAPLEPALREFIRFVLSREGQQCVLDDKLYIPLNADLVRKSQALIE